MKTVAVIGWKLCGDLIQEDFFFDLKEPCLFCGERGKVCRPKAISTILNKKNLKKILKKRNEFKNREGKTINKRSQTRRVSFKG